MSAPPTVHQTTRILVGRSVELAMLQEAREAARAGRSVVCAVRGLAGAGKTALVRAALDSHSPRLTIGGFPPHGNAAPYAGICAALDHLVAQTLAETEATSRALRQAVVSAVGANAGLLVELVPSMRHLLEGDRADRASWDGQARDRVRALLRSVVEAVCAARRPLVLFLDDLHNADDASVQVVRDLVTAPTLGHLLLVLAWRSSDPADARLAELIEADTDSRVIEVGALGQRDIGALIQDLLGPHEQLEAVAACVERKTHGLPLYVCRFLQDLVRAHALTPGTLLRPASVDLDAVERHPTTENVVDYLLGQLEDMQEASRGALAAASGMGRAFELATLAQVLDVAPEQLRAALRGPVRSGLIREVSQGTFSFAHDRVQDAAYLLAEGPQRAALDWRTGRVRLSPHAADPSAHPDLLTVVEQLNRGTAPEAEDRGWLHALNVTAARRAWRAGAPTPAWTHYRCALDLLPDDAWSRAAETRKVLEEAAEAAQAAGAHEAADRVITELLENADGLERTAALEIQIRSLCGRGELPAAVRGLKAALAELGAPTPRRASLLHVLVGFARARWVLRGLTEERLGDLPNDTDPRSLAIARLSMGGATSLYWSEPTLLPLMTFASIRRMFSHGVNPHHPVALAICAMVLCQFGDIEGGRRLGRVALRLQERFPHHPDHRTRLFLSGNVHRWALPLVEALSDAHAAHRDALAAGDVECVAMAGHVLAVVRLIQGRPLSQVRDALEVASGEMVRFGQGTTLRSTRVFAQVVYNLLGRAEDPGTLAGPQHDGAVLTAAHEDRDEVTVFFHHLGTLHCRVVLGRWQDALDSAGQARRHVAAAVSTVHVPWFWMLDAIARCRADHSWRGTLRIASTLRWFRRLARDYPANHRHRASLLEAEWARRRGNLVRALERSERAAHEAREAGWGWEELLAWELARDLCGQLALPRAQVGYARCADEARRRLEVAVGGATAAAAPPKDAQAPRIPAELAGFEDLPGPSAGIDTVLSLLRNTQEQFDASSAALVLCVGPPGTERVVAVADETARVEDESLDDSTALCGSIARFALRTGETVLVADAPADPVFGASRDVRLRGTLSALCIPLFQGEEPLGAVQLESTRRPAAFEGAQPETLAAVFGVCAAVVRTARLADGLAVRTAELHASHRSLSEEKGRLQHQLRHLQKMDALGTLAGGVAHELNNLLTPILCAHELLESELPDPPDYLRSARAATEQAATVVQRLLSFSRMGASTTDTVELAPLVEEVVALLRQTHRTARVDLRLASVGTSVRGDRSRIHQIVLNLCVNALGAVAAQADGHVEVAVEHTAEPTSMVALTVRDNGTGMDAETLARATEPFFTTKPLGKGTGLGLAVVHGIVQELDGTLSLSSEPGVGTTVVVRLPVVAMEPEVESVRPQPAPRAARVLVVDDNDAVRRSACAMLRALGHETVPAASGAEALERLEAATPPVQLVLLDVSMPGMSGIEVSRAIRARGLDVQIILWSGLAAQHAEEGRAAGADAVIGKPIRLAELRRAIGALRQS